MVVNKQKGITIYSQVKKHSFVTDNTFELSRLGAALIFIGVNLIAIYPLLRTGFYVSDDGEWMVIRLTAFYQSLVEGQFPVRFLGRLNDGYGYPVANFLYPGFLYIGSLFKFAGLGFVDSIKAILIISVIGSSSVLYKYLRLSFGRLASLVGSCAFTLSPYLLYDLYKRGSVGEVFAFAPAIMCLYSIERHKRMLLAFATSFLVLSHNTLAVLFLLVISLYVIALRKWESFVSIALGIGMTVFFWFPAIYERKYVLFDSINISVPANFFVDQLNVPLIGGVYVLAVLGLLFQKRINEGRNRFFLSILVISLFLSSSISSHVWKIEDLAKFIQFPYRFLSLQIIAGSWLIASFFHKLKRAGSAIFLIIVLILLPIGKFFSSIEYVSRDEGYYTTNEGTTTVADEYMPQWAVEKPQDKLRERLKFVKGRGLFTPEKITTQQVRGQLVNEENSIIQINSIYYPGWGIIVDGHPATIDYSNPYGFIQVSVPNGTHSLFAEFRETFSRFIVDIISGIFFFVAIVFASHSAFGRKRNYK